MKKNFLLIILISFFISCDNKEKASQVKRIDFITAVKQDFKTTPELVRGEYIAFTFLNLYYLKDTTSEDYTRSLHITIPVTDSAFTFGNDSTHSFKHLVSDCGKLCPDIKIEKIENAKISGKRIDKNKWRIVAKTKYFDFKRIIDTSIKALEKETVNL